MKPPTLESALAATVGHETILLVDDEEFIRLMLGEVLRLQGYTVLEAGGGANALAQASDFPRATDSAHPAEVPRAAGLPRKIDLLATDLVMPGMNGWDLAKTLRTTRPTLPILFISGQNDRDTARWGRMDQPVEHLFKPFSMEAFLHKVRHMLDIEKKPGADGEKAGAGSPPAPSVQ